jgi:hypothetical protein
MVLGVSLVGSIGSMMGTYFTPPEKTFQKHAFWLVRVENARDWPILTRGLGFQCVPSCHA